MEGKEIVRKSVPIPNKWLKELLDFLAPLGVQMIVSSGCAFPVPTPEPFIWFP